MNRAERRAQARNMKVFLARAATEARPGKVMIAHVKHDDGCPSLTTQSMLYCTCKPIIDFTEWR